MTTAPAVTTAPVVPSGPFVPFGPAMPGVSPRPRPARPLRGGTQDCRQPVIGEMA